MSVVRRSALQRERLVLYLWIIVASTAIGAVYGLVTLREGSSLINLAIGAVNGGLIAAGIGGIEIFLLRNGPVFLKRLLRLPLIAVVAMKTLVYAPIITLVPAMHLLGLLLPGLPPTSRVDMRTEMTTVGFSVAVTLVFVIIVQAASLVGGRTFLDLILGRYRRPRQERRFFLFVDVVGSTPIAERLGPLQAHRMLAMVFSAVAEPIAERRGGIYQSVGDEIVITWTEVDGAREGRPVRCFLEMQAALANVASQFRQCFGAVPELRGALHLGEVVAGEVGEQRRAIVFHGDTVNATARLEQATRELGCRFIVSAYALQVLGPISGVDYRDLGPIALRGFKEPVRACAVASSAARAADAQPAQAVK
jgi:adenylate cyclase